MVIPVILALGSVISMLELLRVKRLLYIDFMRMISGVFLVIFVLVPLIFHTLGPLDSPRFFWFGSIDYDNNYLAVTATLIAGIGYCSIVGGFVIGNRLHFVQGVAKNFAIFISRLTGRSWLLMAMLWECISVAALYIYITRRGGNLLLLLQYSGQVRVGLLPSGVEESTFTFLTYAMVGLFSTFILIGLSQKSCLISFLTLFSILTSFVVLWLKAGRLHLANFLLVLFVVLMGKHRAFKALGAFGWLVTFFAILFAGKYWLGVSAILDLPSDLSGYVRLFASELAFPYLSLVNTIESGDSFRFFGDVMLALLYVFVNPLVIAFSGSPLNLGLSVAKVNTLNILGTTHWGEIPVDIVTLGYFNGGLIGVLLTCFTFGIIVAWFNTALVGDSSVVKSLRWAFMVFLSTVGTVYADPVNVLRDGLYLIMPFFIIFGLMILQPNRTYRKSAAGLDARL